MPLHSNNHGLKRLGSEQKASEGRGDFNEGTRVSALRETQGSNYGGKILYFPKKNLQRVFGWQW